MAYEDGPTGVGGWMMLFLFGFGLVSPGMLAFGTMANLYSDPGVATALGDNWLAYQVAEWAIVALGLAIIATIVWRLYNRQDRQTVRLTIAAIPIVAFGIPLLDIAATAIIGGYPFSELFAALAPDFVRAAIYCAVWCSYFTVSKRVANTYLGEGGTSEAEAFE
jgi:hypothetical protein